MPFRYFEDFRVGMVMEYGQRRLTRDEIVAFATRYDPQPMHLDEEAAKHTLLGGLAASGWHTSSLLMRMNVDHLLRDSSCLGSPGIKETRWLKPVRPDDVLSVRTTVLESRPSRSRPEMGLVVLKCEVLRQNGDVVLTQEGTLMFGRRPNGEAA